MREREEDEEREGRRERERKRERRTERERKREIERVCHRENERWRRQRETVGKKELQRRRESYIEGQNVILTDRELQYLRYNHLIYHPHLHSQPVSFRCLPPCRPHNPNFLCNCYSTPVLVLTFFSCSHFLILN